MPLPRRLNADLLRLPWRLRRSVAQTRAVLDASQVWQVEQLHTEEGRLDEVFRSITMPDTKQEATK
mgnify:CR=1 FL=1